MISMRSSHGSYHCFYSKTTSNLDRRLNKKEAEVAFRALNPLTTVNGNILSELAMISLVVTDISFENKQNANTEISKCKYLLPSAGTLHARNRYFRL